ncbi:hypothetical protein F7725_019452 [Dissostichus mawsoni]|uniref:Uncharacterized protein n=1 Tax=Dissostichus mawsoni TaxID=36200 RepID=A0A7J5YKN6_DISMA|nr:hypothetical protein F7725_019452 [Dissostichus mawsoni]
MPRSNLEHLASVSSVAAIALPTGSHRGPMLPQSTTAPFRTSEYDSAAEQGSRARGDKTTDSQVHSADYPPETRRQSNNSSTRSSGRQVSVFTRASLAVTRWAADRRARANGLALL